MIRVFEFGKASVEDGEDYPFFDDLDIYEQQRHAVFAPDVMNDLRLQLVDCSDAYPLPSAAWAPIRRR